MHLPVMIAPHPAADVAAPTLARPDDARLAYLDATRAFALVLGVIFHASLSFSPAFLGWAVQDVSTSPAVSHFIQLSHAFRMELFFLLAGFFSHGVLRRRGLGDFVRSRLLRVGVPFVVGWFLLRPLLVSGWIMGAASLRGDYAFWDSLRAGFASLQTLPAGIFTGSHLWFLYYLLLVTALALATRSLVARLPAYAAQVVRTRLDDATRWLADSPWALAALVPPTAVALGFMRFWGMDTPDQTLQPHLPVLGVYAGFFGLGWLFARRQDAMARFGRLSVLNLLGAGVGGVAVTQLGGIQSDPGHPHFRSAHVGFLVGYALLMWTLVRVTLGIFQKWLDRPRPLVRYVADSSYWMYLVHLPVVVWLQVAVAEVEVSWGIKLAGISAVTVALALLGYDGFVRSTWLGALLNGHRRARAIFTAHHRAESSNFGVGDAR